MNAQLKQLIKQILVALKSTIPTLIPLLRQGLLVVGTALATNGVINTGQVDIFVGISLTVLGAVWKWIEMVVVSRAKKGVK